MLNTSFGLLNLEYSIISWMTNNVRWVRNISKGHVYRQTDTVQIHAETLEHPYIGQVDLGFCAQLLFLYKDKKETTKCFISFFIL